MGVQSQRHRKRRKATAKPTNAGDLPAIGFGTTVAMWAVGYVGHMPLTHIPPIVFVSLMLLCVVGGGWVVGRCTPRGVEGGVWIGLISAGLNLLILGSMLRQPHGGQLVPHAWLWLPGAFVTGGLLGAIGAFAARFSRPAIARNEINWVAGLAWVTCAAAMLLIAVGGLVTGFRAGMAVPDWPNTYGSNMFLFPLTLMTGGVFYEHAHRLLGTLVGLTVFVLAIYLTARTNHRRSLIVLAWAIGLCVFVQGLFGGFRVTDDSYCLAVVHGFFAHAILGALVALAVMLSHPWQLRLGAEQHPSAETDRVLTALLVGVLLLQTLLGTLVRQVDMLFFTHIAFGAMVAVVCVGVGVRAWGIHPNLAVLRRGGIALMLLVFLQINLGIVSVIFRTPPVGKSPTAEMLATSDSDLLMAPLPALITTVHQSTAAILLGLAVLLAVWTWRLVERLPVGDC